MAQRKRACPYFWRSVSRRAIVSGSIFVFTFVTDRRRPVWVWHSMSGYAARTRPTSTKSRRPFHRKHRALRIPGRRKTHVGRRPRPRSPRAIRRQRHRADRKLSPGHLPGQLEKALHPNSPPLHRLAAQLEQARPLRLSRQPHHREAHKEIAAGMSASRSITTTSTRG